VKKVAAEPPKQSPKEKVQSLLKKREEKMK